MSAATTAAMAATAVAASDEHVHPSSRISSAIPDSDASVETSASTSVTAAVPNGSVTEHHQRLSSRGSANNSRRGSPFRARSSKLDLERLERDKDEFRGFFVLFWMGMAFYTILTLLNNWQTTGVFFGTGTFRHMSSNFLHLVRDDLMIVGSLFSGLFLAYLQKWHFVRHRFVRLVLQHSMQTAFLFGWLGWIWQRNPPWVQAATLTLHVIAMLFKIHSYNQYNGDLNERYWVDRRLRKELKILERADDGSSATVAAEMQAIKEQMAELESELKPHGNVRYPENIGILNFVDYLLVPTLVYELEYPRTPRIRWMYVGEKVLATFGSIMLMYITVEHYIVPVLLEIKRLTFVGCLLRLILPFMICYLMTFYIIFECVANGFAELTRFADRSFYDDWWNSCTFDQFARKWNKPVHEFLLRHVYLESINTYKVSKHRATFLTFLFSSCLHELAMIMVARRIRMYLFVLQMFQLPLIWIGRLPWSRKHPVAGNAFFWFSMFAGPPLLAVCYLWEHYWH
ncbi:MBOAT, membrane-bound O-acyltransferase family-domain-containing protein [Catenaria anguillulae PL171]|uniref:O-acyltransferase n=1 Tax=Catenaria anguillulae PL171 TaxID=765915 RepID=A0A1Y2HEM0_9FUNG|nr:MBOAT, membrane-bound O-acyltransferase family-domain-containing protein [Catenaria anguillulae PL171]